VIYKTSKKEEIWLMNKNKIKKKITDPSEINKLRDTDEIKKLEMAKTLIEI
jgi:hypothetical protein